MEIAEPAPEGKMLFGRERLVAEKNHEVLGKRAIDLVELEVRKPLGQIDAADLGADDGGQLVDLDGLVWRTRGRQ